MSEFMFIVNTLKPVFTGVLTQKLKDLTLWEATPIVLVVVAFLAAVSWLNKKLPNRSAEASGTNRINHRSCNNKQILKNSIIGSGSEVKQTILRRKPLNNNIDHEPNEQIIEGNEIQKNARVSQSI